jgi:hypothetical protein
MVMIGALTGWLWVIIPAAAIGLFIAAAADSLLRHTGRMSAGQLLFRVLTGDHLDAKLRNNRTWTKPATRPLHRPVDWHMSWWSRQPRIKRAAPAWLLLVGLPAAAYGLYAAAALTAALLTAAALTATAWGILTAARWLARRHHRTHVVRPLATALAGQLKQHQAVTAASLKVRPRLDTCRPGDDVLRIDGIPDHYAAQDRERKFVENLIRARVPVDLDFDWQTHRHPMRLVGRCSAAPPLAVTAADWLPVIDSLSPSQYFLGVSANEHPEIWDASEEDPNAMVGGKTRRGKTNLNLGVAAQALRRGEQVTAIDHKRVSLRCLTGVPGFTLANDPSDVDAMWAAIHQFRAAMDTTIAGHGDGTPHTLILEEIPQLYRLFHDHWSLTRPRGGLVTNMPPARDIAAILNQGAQFGFRVLLGGQDLKDQLLFGYRHAFGLALMAGYTPAQWAYTIGTKPAPLPPPPRGPVLPRPRRRPHPHPAADRLRRPARRNPQRASLAALRTERPDPRHGLGTPLDPKLAHPPPPPPHPPHRPALDRPQSPPRPRHGTQTSRRLPRHDRERVQDGPPPQPHPRRVPRQNPGPPDVLLDPRNPQPLGRHPPPHHHEPAMTRVPHHETPGRQTSFTCPGGDGDG